VIDKIVRKFFIRHLPKESGPPYPLLQNEIHMQDYTEIYICNGNGKRILAISLANSSTITVVQYGNRLVYRSCEDEDWNPDTEHPSAMHLTIDTEKDGIEHDIDLRSRKNK